MDPGVKRDPAGRGGSGDVDQTKAGDTLEAPPHTPSSRGARAGVILIAAASE